MSNCKVELKCKLRIDKIVRYNILVDGEKYSKIFSSKDSDDIVQKDAKDACKSGLLDIIWEVGWRNECPE